MEKNYIEVQKDERGNQIVSARLLHEKLGVGRDFTTWIKERIDKYKFEENIDFVVISSFPQNGGKGGRPKTDYILQLDMAKELSMIENSEQGRKIRKYFIECEKTLIKTLLKDETLIRTQKSIETIRLELEDNFIVKRIADRIEQVRVLEAQAKYINKELQRVYKDIKEIADLKGRILKNNIFDCTINENTYDVSKEPMPKLFK